MSKKTDISKLNHKAPFKVPEGYFDKLPDIIQSRVGIDGEGENMEVFDSLKVDNKHPFQVPEDYFRGLPDKIHAKTIAKKSSVGWSLNWKRQQVWALVPAICALFIIGYFVYNGNQTQNLSTDELIAQVSTKDLVAYLETSDISADEIINIVDLDELDLELDEDTNMLDELDFDSDELEDIMLEFDMETGV